MDLTAAVIHIVSRIKNNEPNTLPGYCKINKAQISGLVDTHLSCPPDPTFTMDTGPPNPPTSTFYHPQHKQFPGPDHTPQPTIHTHSLDNAYPIHQPNKLRHTKAHLTLFQIRTFVRKHRATGKQFLQETHNKFNQMLWEHQIIYPPILISLAKNCAPIKDQIP